MREPQLLVDFLNYDQWCSIFGVDRYNPPWFSFIRQRQRHLFLVEVSTRPDWPSTHFGGPHDWGVKAKTCNFLNFLILEKCFFRLEKHYWYLPKIEAKWPNILRENRKVSMAIMASRLLKPVLSENYTILSSLVSACLHELNKSSFFGGPVFIQPIRAIW